jgi:hypothetical protein
MAELSTWAKAWGSAWGSAWGKTEESGKSGAQRLWMYELYAASIEEDKKKRDESVEKEVIRVKIEEVIVKKPIQKAVIKVKTKEVIFKKPIEKPIFIRNRELESLSSTLTNYLNLLDALPHIRKAVTKVKAVIAKDDEVIIKKRKQENWLLLLAA